jgi:hypothetical protein
MLRVDRRHRLEAHRLVGARLPSLGLRHPNGMVSGLPARSAHETSQRGASSTKSEPQAYEPPGAHAERETGLEVNRISARMLAQEL